ncbi:alpha/beta hydrolase-fold protein [Fictibacillus sp. Mic-4]|uniref:alpha/beta hydrolase n=1 Tax=Fictibacillus TaxID=1329200 RepID=UPI000421D811|nr:alpha/beta hydrolase-fold protein [Fictibacillus gelatini]
MATINGEIKEQMIYSNTLKEEIRLLIYYPENYSPLYKYPVLIAQDGQDYFRLGKLASTADELIRQKEIEELIIVAVDHNRGKDRPAKYHPEGEKHESYLRFLAFELVPFINEHFATYLLGAGFGLMGDSLGGYVALKAGLLFPRTFGKLILQSPFIDNDIIHMAETANTLDLLTIYHSIGDEEHQFKSPAGGIKDFLTPNRTLHSVLSNKQLEYRYTEFNGNHLWANWQKDLYPALKFCYGL